MCLRRLIPYPRRSAAALHQARHGAGLAGQQDTVKQQGDDGSPSGIIR